MLVYKHLVDYHEKGKNIGLLLFLFFCLFVCLFVYCFFLHTN